jgi:hypothetical protein
MNGFSFPKAAFFFLLLLILFPLFLYKQLGHDIGLVLPLENINDEVSYLSYVNHAITHDFPAGDPNHIENRHTPLLRPAWFEYVLGRFCYVSGLSITGLYWINTFLFPLLFLWILYRLLRVWGLSRNLSALTAFLSLTCLKIDVFRVMHPRVSIVFFYLHLLLVSRWLAREKKKYLLPLALSGALQFYSYSFYWVFNLVFTPLLCLFLSLIRKKRAAKGLLISFVLACLGAWPYAQNMLAVTGHPAFGDLMFRMGYAGSDFVFSKTNLLLLVFALFFWKRERQNGNSWRVFFLLAVVVSGFICLNQQVVTGKQPSSSRYVWFILQPVLLFCVLRTFSSFIFTSKFRLNLVLLAGALFFSHKTFQRSRPLELPYAVLANSARKAQNLINFINTHLPDDQVIACSIKQPDGLAYALRLYTRQYVYASFSSLHQLLDKKELSQRVHMIDYLQGLSLKEYSARLDKRPDIYVTEHYGSHFHRQNGDYGKVPEEVIEGLKKDYRDFLKRREAGEPFDYRLDYIVLKAGKSLPLEISGAFKKIFSSNFHVLWSRKKR